MKNIKKLPDVTIKIKLVGDSGVGKTSIIESLISRKCPEKKNPTVGVDYKNHFMII